VEASDAIVRKILLVLAGAVVLCLGAALWRIGPRNVIGMARYDQRHEGNFKPGDPAPDVAPVALDGKTSVRLSDRVGEKPLVLIFGSYT